MKLRNLYIQNAFHLEHQPASTNAKHKRIHLFSKARESSVISWGGGWKAVFWLFASELNVITNRLSVDVYYIYTFPNTLTSVICGLSVIKGGL